VNPGYMHQCNGKFLASVGFTYNASPLELFVPSANFTFFGDGFEPYQQPKVMACCGAYDEEQEEQLWPVYAENCMADFRQQACMSLSAGLKTFIDDGHVPLLAEPKAKDLQNWIAARTTQCMNELELADSSTHPDVLMATWNLPDEDAPWEDVLEDVFLRINFAFIDDLYLPATPNECTSLHDNDTVVFTDQSGTPLINSYDVELDEADADLLGPIIGSGRVSGEGGFASLSTSCMDPYCSTASFSVGTSYDFAIDSMVLYVDGPLVVSNGTLNETITDGRIELYKQALGFTTCIGGSCTYTIPAGNAHFVVVGVSDGDVATLALPSSTDITATMNSAGVWWLNSFQIEYVDDASYTWTLTVNSSEWF